MRIGLVGGTFDPVHLGHLALGEEARVQLELDRVLFLPAGQPWMKAGEQLSPARHRVEMLELAVSSNPYFQVCLEEINRPGLTYTVDTLDALVEKLGVEATLYFIVGQDAMRGFHRWKEPGRILELCRLVVVERPGHQDFDWMELVSRFPAAKEKAQVLSMPMMGISATEVRRRTATGVSLRYQVPDQVAEYIEKHCLYREQTTKPSVPLPAIADETKAIAGNLLEVALARGALKYGDFTLASGKSSKYYFDGRLLSLDPDGSRLIAEALLPVLRQAEVDAVGGLTLGADPIVSAIALSSGLRGEGISGFIVRKEAKAHGTGQSIEGPLRSGSRVAIVDDVCTTGGSLFQAIEAAEAAGCSVVTVVTVLDRKEGGSEELRRLGYDFLALLEANLEGSIEVAVSVQS
jgi:nicotinate (nicotinamide) nucleotide adenylyltransferase